MWKLRKRNGWNRLMLCYTASENYCVINPATEHWPGKWHHHLLFLYMHIFVSSAFSSPADQPQWWGGVQEYPDVWGCVPGHQCVWGIGQSRDPGVRPHRTWYLYMELHQAWHWSHKSRSNYYTTRSEDSEAGWDIWRADGHFKQCSCKHWETGSGCTWLIHLPGYLWLREWAQNLLLLRASRCPR